jgi:UDP-N-acetylmuramate: L-alanyl-gamma-D-glutamyl-meso-diaminopimelate ligase
MKGKLFTTVETFGVGPDAKWQARDISLDTDKTRFSVYYDGEHWADFTTHLIGDFNIRNCLAVIIAADAWGISKEKMQEAFDTFKSVKRRMEVRGVERGVTIIDDFAHHPTAVDETLRALRQRYAENRLIAVFEPRSRSSRLSIFEDRYKDAFMHADQVIIAGVFNLEDAKTYGDVMNVQRLVANIAATGKPAETLENADAIIESLRPELKDGDVVAIMSNGGFGGIHEKLLDVLRT